MNDLPQALVLGIIAILVAIAIYLDTQSVNDCRAVGGEYVWDHCIDREAIIEEY